MAAMMKKLGRYLREPSEQMHSLEQYVEGGGNVDILFKGTTALCEASRGGFITTVDYLLRCGAGVNVCDKRGCSPLYIAASHGHFYTLRKLIDAGADTEIINNTGFTALTSSLQNRKDSCSKILIAAGACVNNIRPNTHGIKASLLYYVLFARGEEEIAESIIKAGIYPEKFVPPLSYILLEDSQIPMRLIQLMLEAGCSVRCDGWIEMMEKYGDWEITERQLNIVQFLADVNSTPPSLQHICRVIVRIALSGNGIKCHIVDKIEKLPLPDQIKTYVCLVERSS